MTANVVFSRHSSVKVEIQNVFKIEGQKQSNYNSFEWVSDIETGMEICIESGGDLP